VARSNFTKNTGSTSTVPNFRQRSSLFGSKNSARYSSVARKPTPGGKAGHASATWGVSYVRHCRIEFFARQKGGAVLAAAQIRLSPEEHRVDSVAPPVRADQGLREGQKAFKKVELHEEVVRRVLSRLKENDDLLADGSSGRAHAAHAHPHGPRVAHWHITSRPPSARSCRRSPATASCPHRQESVRLLRLPGRVRPGHAAGPQLRHAKNL
jgi:hypothetical protein